MSTSPSSKRPRSDELQTLEIIQDSTLWLLPDKILISIMNFVAIDYPWNESLTSIMLTCKKFNEIVTTHQKLNRKFVFNFDTYYLNGKTIAKNRANRIALLVSQRKFERVKVSNVQDSSSSDHLSTLLQKFGHAVEEIKISNCSATENTYCDIFKLLPYVKNISFYNQNEILSNYDIDEVDPPSFLHLKKLKFEIKDPSHYSSRSKVNIFSNAKQLCRIESSCMRLISTSNLTKLKELKVSNKLTKNTIEFLPSGLNSQLKKFASCEIDMKDLRKFFSSQNEITEMKIKTKSSDYDTMKVICGMNNLKKLTVDLEYDMLELENLSNFTVEELTFTVNGSSGNNIAWNTQKVEKFVKIFKGVKSLRIIDEIFTSNGASNYNLNFDSLKNLQDIEIIFNGSEEFFNSVSLSKLTKFTLESDTEYSATGIKDFVKRNPNIKRLKVDSLQMLLICMKRMKNLEVVTIDNEDWFLEHKERELLQLLRQTQTLKELHLEKLEDGADFIESFYKERLPIKLFHN